MIKHLLSIEDLTRSEILSILHHTQNYQNNYRSLGMLHPGTVLATLFFESSTRTRLSFESAMLKLGGGVISASDLATTSMIKGESLEDTIRIVSESYVDIMVVRHPDKGAVQLAAEYSAKPVINGGDGMGEHPTQALCDMYALWSRLGDLTGVNVSIFGDVERSRAAHSFKKGLEIMGASVQEIPYDSSSTYNILIRSPSTKEADAIYITRPQLERGIPGGQHINIEGYNKMAHELTRMFPKALIMHPLPRTGEVSKTLDADPRSIYFEQAKAGVPIRTTVLAYLLNIVQL